MPVIAVHTAATRVGESGYTTALDPCNGLVRERGRDAKSIRRIAVKQHRVAAVQHQTFAVQDGHRHPDTIVAWDDDLANRYLRQVWVGRAFTPMHFHRALALKLVPACGLGPSAQ